MTVKLEECCNEQGQLAEDSKEGLGSDRAVVPMMMMRRMMMSDCQFSTQKCTLLNISVPNFNSGTYSKRFPAPSTDVCGCEITPA
jgi:hypothetical protein